MLAVVLAGGGASLAASDLCDIRGGRAAVRGSWGVVGWLCRAPSRGIAAVLVMVRFVVVLDADGVKDGVGSANEGDGLGPRGVGQRRDGRKGREARLVFAYDLFARGWAALVGPVGVQMVAVISPDDNCGVAEGWAIVVSVGRRGGG